MKKRQKLFSPELNSSVRLLSACSDMLVLLLNNWNLERVHFENGKEITIQKVWNATGMGWGR